MKVCVIQPPYENSGERGEELFRFKMEELKKCSNDLDVIVLPEYSDVPFATKTFEETVAVHQRFMEKLEQTCKETAVRCQATVFYNALDFENGQYYNTTFALNKKGELVGKYKKRHIPPAEKALQIASDYTSERDEVYTLTIDGVKYAFLTCYDFYFYEYFPRIAKENVDVIIGCSLQRSDTHQASEIMSRFLAYQTNAYVVRCSVSMDENSDICGASMVVAPNGDVLLNMESKRGSGVATFDPQVKYLKPAGFGRPFAPHHEYIEEGKNPWMYGQNHSSNVLDDEHMPYPRVCAHRGFSTIAPENSMPAFGAAVAMGADEIELDIWATKDGELVSIHDHNVERVSDGHGMVAELTFEELMKFDFGGLENEHLKGMHIVKFEDVLKQFACRTIMNLHVKIWDFNMPEDHMEKIVGLIRKYGCEKYVYFMTTNDEKLEKAGKMAPEIHRCVGHDENRPYEIVERAIALHADKVQFFRPYFNQAMFDKAKENGIICNVFFSDDEERTREYYKMGMDTLLTNDFHPMDTLMRELDENYRKRKQ